MDGLTVGRRVHFVLSEDQAAQLNHDMELEAAKPYSQQQFHGNRVQAGDHVAADIVRIFTPEGMVNLRVIFDGSFDRWVTSAPYDANAAPFTWHWIEKA